MITQTPIMLKTKEQVRSPLFHVVPFVAGETVSPAFSLSHGGSHVPFFPRFPQTFLHFFV